MNKKVSRILLLLLALLSAVSIANATEQREAQRKTGLSFSGTTAYCYANCKSDNHEDKVTANVMLYQGSNVIASWSAQGIGSVTISERMFGMIILHLWGISGTKAIYCSAPNAEQKSELQQTPHFRVDIMSGQNIAVTTPQAIQPSICM